MNVSGYMNGHVDTRPTSKNGEGFDAIGLGESVAGPSGDGQGATAAHCDEDSSGSKGTDRSPRCTRTLLRAPSAATARQAKALCEVSFATTQVVRYEVSEGSRLTPLPIRRRRRCDAAAAQQEATVFEEVLCQDGPELGDASPWDAPTLSPASWDVDNAGNVGAGRAAQNTRTHGTWSPASERTNSPPLEIRGSNTDGGENAGNIGAGRAAQTMRDHEGQVSGFEDETPQLADLAASARRRREAFEHRLTDLDERVVKLEDLLGAFTSRSSSMPCTRPRAQHR